jgi:hypothetical protein
LARGNKEKKITIQIEEKSSGKREPAIMEDEKRLKTSF